MRNEIINPINLRTFEKTIRIDMYKLTLSIKEDVAQKAKEYARNSGRSLSALIENYLIELMDHPTSQVSEGISQYMGVAKLPKDFDEKKERLNYLKKKHG